MEKKLISIRNNERIWFLGKFHKIYAKIQIGSDWKYLMIPDINDIWIGDHNMPYLNENDKGYCGTWTNQLAVDSGRGTVEVQLTMEF